MKIKEKLMIKGEYQCFKLADFVTEKSKTISKLRKYVKTQQTAILEALLASGEVISVCNATNLIPTVGRNVLARLLAGDTTYTGEIDYGALGNGVAPSFTNASTILSNEVYRKQASSQSFDDNIAYIDWFIASGDVADQTFTEFAAFIDGTGAADSGQAWSLLATGGWIKSGSMFISAKYTINN